MTAAGIAAPARRIELGCWKNDPETNSAIWVATFPQADESQIKPYIPQDNPELAASAKEASMDCPTDVITLVLTFLKSPKDIARASLVCKKFYAAAKNHMVWKILLSNCLPAVKIVFSSTFSVEQQAKIALQRIFSDRKPIIEIKSKIESQITLLHSENMGTNAPSLDPTTATLALPNSVVFMNIDSTASLLNTVKLLDKALIDCFAKYNDPSAFTALIEARETPS